MAALCTMGNKSGLIDRICVARNEKVGVYGFVFYRGMSQFSTASFEPFIKGNGHIFNRA